MPWKLDYSAEDRILSVKTEGPFTAADLEDMTRASVEKLREEHALRVLLDFSNAITQVSMTELYQLPDLYTGLRAPRLGHLAIVIPTDQRGREAFQFYEDLAINRGIFVKLFNDHDKAKAWLMEFKTS